MSDPDPTVYVNDSAITETEVYHGRAAHATKHRWTRDHVEEVPLSEAVSRGLRPCKQCDPPRPPRELIVDGDGVDPTSLDWQTVTKQPVDVEATRIRDPFQVVTREGTMEAEDAWLIRGVEGELYPCDPDIFAQTYMPDPTKVSKHTDEDVLAVVRELHERADYAIENEWVGALQEAIEVIESELLDYDTDPDD